MRCVLLLVGTRACTGARLLAGLGSGRSTGTVADQIVVASTAHAHTIATPTPGMREVARETFGVAVGVAVTVGVAVGAGVWQLDEVRSHGPDPDGQMLEHLKLFSDAHSP